MGDKESDDLELQTLLSENETKYKASSNPEKEGQAKDQEEEHFVRWRKTAIYISCVSIIFTTGFGLMFFVISQMAKSPAAFGFAGDDKEQKNGGDRKTQPKRKNVPMDDDVYDALFSVLSEAKSLSDWPKNSDKGLRQRVYRKWKSNMYVLKEIHNPVAGKLERRIVERATNCIVIKKSEVAQLVDSAYEETKGEGAEKLRNQMSQLYCGKVSEEICPNCGKKFQCYSQGVFESGGALQVYSDDSVYCDVCQLHAEL